MISRVILCVAVIGWSGVNLLPPTEKPTVPLTPAQLQIKAKQKSISNVCKGKRKSQTVKDLCRRWEKHDA